jgi:hypothetical protein
MGALEPAAGRSRGEVLSIGDKGDILVNGSINLDDLDDFDLSSGASAVHQRCRDGEREGKSPRVREGGAAYEGEGFVGVRLDWFDV